MIRFATPAGLAPFYTLMVLQLLVPSELAAAQPEPPASSKEAPTAEVVITMTRDPDIAPVMEISSSELSSYGGDSPQELLDSLQPRIHSSMSNEVPVVLINGRLAGQTELQNLPREAILRVEVLPEKAALRYGFPDNRRVVNFVLREHFQGITTALLDSQATEGDGQKGETHMTLAQVDHESQATIKADYIKAEQLLESERGITANDSSSRTLLPATNEARLGATFTHPFFNLRPSVEGSVDVKSSDSQQGLATTGTDSAESDVLLRQHTGTASTHFATRVSGLLGDLTWSASATFDGATTHTRGGTGIDAEGALLVNRTDSSANTVGIDAFLGGRVATLAAGTVAANVDVNVQAQDSRAQTQLSGSPTTISHLSRTTGQISANINIPFTSRDADVLPFLGDLAARLHLGAQEVSNFGTLSSEGGGVMWKPVKTITFGADFRNTQQAPTVQALLAPAVVTPGVQMFDFVKDETVYVTQITGGNEELQPSENRITTLSLSVGPFRNQNGFMANFERSREGNAVGTIPPVTSAVEAAFPDNFLRNPSGTLLEVDDRSVNLALREKDDLEWGFYLLVPSPPATASSAGDTSRPNANGPGGLQLRISLYDTWYFRETILARNSVPELDLLNGAPSSSITGNSVAGTQPRHAIDLHTDLIDGGFVAQLRSRWNSATELDSGTPSARDRLHFSALSTIDLRLFAELAQMPGSHGHVWAKGMRVSLLVSNLFDTHQKVRDTAGATPTGFEPGYIDPLGRVVTLSIRKAF